MKEKLFRIKNTVMISMCFFMLLFHVISIYLLLRYNFNSIYTNQFFLNMSGNIILAIYVIIMVTFFKLFGAFKVGYYRVGEVIYSQILAIFISNIFLYLLILLTCQYFFNILLICILFGIQAIISVLFGWLSNKLYFSLYQKHELLLLYGSNPNLIIKKMNARNDKYDIRETISLNESIDKIKMTLKKFDTLAMFDVDANTKSELMKVCYEEHKIVYIIPSISDILLDSPIKIDLFDTPIFMYKDAEMSTEEKFFKRLFDLIIVLPVFVIASPFMLITAIAIKLYDGGPVIYKQKRLTKDGKIFNVYKFRSMKVNAEADGKARLASKEDNRITPVGKIIRAIRFDELPQLLNIINGDMSIVGPRPERPEIANVYYNEIPEFKYRLMVKAGLTGYAQVLGKYNSTPLDKVKLDLIYITNYSLKLDFKLILMTIKILFMHESTEGIDEGKKLANEQE